jgi:hypothetical protein
MKYFLCTYYKFLQFTQTQIITSYIKDDKLGWLGLGR